MKNLTRLIILLCFLLVSIDSFWYESIPCNSTEGNYEYGKTLVKTRNTQERKNIQPKILTWALWISSINFLGFPYTLSWNTLEFWKWIIPFGWPMCYGISRKYQVKRISKNDFDNLITRIKISKESNYYSSWWKLGDWFELFKTWSINGMTFLITNDVWWYDWSTNYELILQWWESYYTFSWPHNNTPIDIILWKRIIKSIKF